MFTGIISGQAVITAMPAEKFGRFELEVSWPQGFLEQVKIGDSIAINGACLTVVAFSGNNFSVDVSPETMNRTNFSALELNQVLNLECALKLGDSLDGHLVQGHIDGVVIVADIISIQDNQKIICHFKESKFIKYIAEKGSVTLNGVSLTVNDVNSKGFSVNIIPHTLKQTNLGNIKLGDELNLEIDLLSRYCINFLEHKELA